MDDVRTRRLRLALEDEIERLISLLDRIDGDPDFEPDTDSEPTLGWTEEFSGRGQLFPDPDAACLNDVMRG